MKPNNGSSTPQNFAVYLLGTASGWSQGEWGDVALNGSGIVDGYLVEYQTTAVPLPSTFLLLTPMGIFGGVSLRRSRASRRSCNRPAP